MSREMEEAVGETFPMRQPLQYDSSEDYAFLLDFFNSSLQPSNSTQELSAFMTIMTSTIFSVIFVVGVVGNTFTIYVVTRRIKLKSTTSVYILSLACADLLFVFTSPMFAVQFLLGPDNKFGELGCRLIDAMDILTMLTGVFTLTVMSVDRFFAVVFPLKAMAYRLRAIASYVNIAVWLISFVFSLPMIIMVEQDVAETPAGSVRVCKSLMDEEFDKIYKTVIFVFAFPIPFFIISICYLTIISTLLRKNGSAAIAETSKSRQSKQRVAKMVLIIVIVFFICWLPFWIIMMLVVYGVIQPTKEWLFLNLALVCLSYINSCANPLLYTLLSHNVRRKLRMRGSSTVVSDRISEANTTPLNRKSIRCKNM